MNRKSLIFTLSRQTTHTRQIEMFNSNNVVAVNVNHLLGSMGKEAFLAMNSTMQLVSGDELKAMLYMFDLANKSSFTVEMNCVNDGNNSFSDVVIIKEDFAECGHYHDHMKYMGMNELIEFPNVDRLDLILRAVNSVIKQREVFNLDNVSFKLTQRLVASLIAKNCQK